MNFLFRDSSCFFKLHVQEAGSDTLRHFISATNGDQQAISTLVKIEIQSALVRRLRDGEMPAATAALAEKALLDEYAGWIHWDVTDPLLNIACTLVKRRSLRSLDALQLASSLYFGEYLLPTDHLLFVASDQRLLAAAEAEGLTVWNPEISPIPPLLL